MVTKINELVLIEVPLAEVDHGWCDEVPIQQVEVAAYEHAYYGKSTRNFRFDRLIFRFDLYGIDGCMRMLAKKRPQLA